MTDPRPAVIRSTRSQTVGGVSSQAYVFAVPLDHADGDPSGTRISVFARVLTSPGGEHRPFLVWFQGGPGNRADRPGTPGGWLSEALDRYRVVLLDQRGTGLSTPLTAASIASQGDLGAQAAYLNHFRAPDIAADAEAIRLVLSPNAPWTTLGQSFGGFITFSYLSFYPYGIKEALVAGGIPAIGHSAEDVYAATWKRTQARTAEFFEAWPGSEATAARIRDLLFDHPAGMSGQLLTLRRFLSLGMGLGTESGFTNLGYLLESAFAEGEDRLSEQFEAGAFSELSFARHPMYALLHESIYAEHSAPRWAAASVVGAEDPDAARFTGEMIFPWHFDVDPSLRPLAELADRLENDDSWEDLYDRDQLAHNPVPVRAAVYPQDMFVPHEYSLEVASWAANITITEFPEYQHDGIRAHGADVMSALLGESYPDNKEQS